MTKTEVLAVIESVVRGIMDTKGIAVDALDSDHVLLGGALPIDSLDLAQVVLELQSATGKDPFEGGFIEFQTVGELADLFAA